jgi:hypothetical protein
VNRGTTTIIAHLRDPIPPVKFSGFAAVISVELRAVAPLT